MPNRSPKAIRIWKQEHERISPRRIRIQNHQHERLNAHAQHQYRDYAMQFSIVKASTCLGIRAFSWIL